MSMCESKESKRNLGMDIARIVASLMVVCMHVTAAWKYGEPTTLEWHVSEAYDSLCRSAVPLFFMMSGAFYKNQGVSKTINKIIHYILVFFGISLVYALNDACLNFIFGGGQEQKGLLESVLNYKYHLWYLPAFIFVLTIAPVIVKVEKQDENSIIKYILGLWLVLGIGLNTIITATDNLDDFSLFNRYCRLVYSFSFVSGNHVGYFILGRFLKKNRLTKNRKTIVYILGIATTIGLYALTVLYSNYSKTSDNRWMSTLNLLVLLQAIAWFEFFEDLKVNKKYENAIKSLSPYTFGIYLVHVLFLEWSYKLGIFQENNIIGFGINPILITPVRTMALWLLSLIFVWILRRVCRKIFAFCYMLLCSNKYIKGGKYR